MFDVFTGDPEIRAQLAVRAGEYGKQFPNLIPAGVAVEYFSTGHGGWVPAVVEGFDWEQGTYRLDIQPIAYRAKVRRPGGAVFSVQPEASAEAQQTHQQGGAVEYYSASRGGWVPAIVEGFDSASGSYILDIQPTALPGKVRATTIPGSAVEYYSNSHGGWVPAVVKGFDAVAGTYDLDLQPLAYPEKVRAAAGMHRVPAVAEGNPWSGFGEGCPVQYRHDAQHWLPHGEQKHMPYQQQPRPAPAPFPQAEADALLRPAPPLGGRRSAGEADADAALAKQLAEGGKALCARCGQEHDVDMSCEQFREVQVQNRDADRMLEEFMAKEGMKRCPVCRAPSERKDGSCNFLQCRSDVCKKRTYWCYLCGKQQTLDDHYSHYPNGPYENQCYG